MRIRLADDDRERLGAPEWLDWPPKGLMQSEAEVLQETLGVEPDEYVTWLQGTGVRDAEGREVQEEVEGPNGEKTLSTKRRPPVEALRFRIWQALRRAGVGLELQQVDFNRFGVAVEEDGQAQEPGKDDGPSSPAPTSDSGG